jgi:hypothetical protein
MYAFTSGGILVSASGAAANAEASDFDIYSEISGQPGTIGSIQTGVAMANATDNAVDIQLHFVSLEGKSGTGGVLRLPAHGQLHLSISELPGWENLPQSFQGTLHISSATPIAAVAIRARYNERGDFLLSTTPPAPSDSVDPQDEAFIPQILDGGGYNTQIVIFGGTDEEPSSGNIYFFDAEGQPIDPPVE